MFNICCSARQTHTGIWAQELCCCSYSGSLGFVHWLSAHCGLLIRNEGNSPPFLTPSVGFISFMMCFSLGIRGHEYAKYPWWNVSTKHEVNPVNHEWLLPLLYRAWAALKMKHGAISMQFSSVNKRTTHPPWVPSSQDDGTLTVRHFRAHTITGGKNGTIMFCLPHFHLQKNSQLKPHGWNNMNALFRSGEHAHFWINHNPFWKIWYIF